MHRPLTQAGGQVAQQAGIPGRLAVEAETEAVGELVIGDWQPPPPQRAAPGPEPGPHRQSILRSQRSSAFLHLPPRRGDDARGWHRRRTPAGGVMANLSSVLARAAADHGERPVVRLDDMVLSYSQLQDAAGRMAGLLSSLGGTRSEEHTSE